MKPLRNTFKELTPEIINYCKFECKLLARMMQDFREMCQEVGYVPKQWSGPGWIAAKMFQTHGIPKRPEAPGEQRRREQREVEAEARRLSTVKPRGRSRREPEPRRRERDPELEKAICAALYGGRFEVGTIGRIPGPVYQYDLRSAYPSNMPSLPCPFHVHWEHLPHASHLPRSGIYLAKISFEHPPETRYCGLPFRHEKPHERLTWPLAGMGWYWSPEIEAARRRLGAKIIVLDLWVARRRCNCHLYDFVDGVYAKRNELGPNAKGYPLKLGLNSMYGKTAQRRTGQAPYWDPVAAGLITSQTRAQIVEAVSHDPEAILKIATDAVFSMRPLPLDVGPGLGEWEKKEHPDFFIVKPGVYWSPSNREETVKSRGAPRSIIGKATVNFEEAFDEFFAELQDDPLKRDLILSKRQIPFVTVKLNTIISCKRALARGKPWLAGKWEEYTSDQSFEWELKRDPIKIEICEGYIKTFPQQERIDLESYAKPPPDFDTDPNTYRREHAEDLETEDLGDATDAQPDYDDWNEYIEE